MATRFNSAEKFYRPHVRSFRDGRYAEAMERDLHAFLGRCGVPSREPIVETIVKTVHEVHHEVEACETVSGLLVDHVPAILSALERDATVVTDLSRRWINDACKSFLHYGCGTGDLLIHEAYERGDNLLFDAIDRRSEPACVADLPFVFDWNAVVEDVASEGTYDVAFAVNALRRSVSPGAELTRLRGAADRLILIEEVSRPEDKNRPRQVAALFDWLTDRCLFPDRETRHRGQYGTAAEWHRLLVRTGWMVTAERDLPEGTFSVPGAYRLHVCDAP